jgi:xanthine/CO dehydrogenase XdhC/CoxF family maturation factor
MSNRFLVEQFDLWCDAGDDLILATVIETDGSTYSKAGRHLLINRQKQYVGLVGGGCLEGDLVLQAEEVLGSGQPRIISYDMRNDADDLWGMGLGCRGMMRLLLQRVDAGSGWQPLQQLTDWMRSDQVVAVSLVTASTDPQLAVGSLQLENSEPAPTAVIARAGGLEKLIWSIKPWPRLLILGAGPDTHPVVALARLLGWHITIADHRPELLGAESFAQADECIEMNRDELQNTLPWTSYTAACVMSHHLETDIKYLRVLSGLKLAYTGVLGPAARRDEILRALDLQGSEFASRLRGPVGLEIHADTPQGIALSLLAEIQAVLKP